MNESSLHYKRLEPVLTEKAKYTPGLLVSDPFRSCLWPIHNGLALSAVATDLVLPYVCIKLCCKCSALPSPLYRSRPATVVVP